MLGGRGSEVRDSTALLSGADASERRHAPRSWEDTLPDRPAMQLYQPGARSRNRLCPPDDNIKSGDSPVDRKQESVISHRKEGGDE
ncbi:Regulator of nonsense transcripts 3B [Microtus ochrogaster]|uniref:Regulator of nonsense transcripts 3B n=1 Tax=Microtus ochrogaster TaxID=79684 RepID=A0A8J6GN67_MICOH|nr:Regulator of nonsense transcripts 3B [Microtus ochrogaster]